MMIKLLTPSGEKMDAFFGINKQRADELHVIMETCMDNIIEKCAHTEHGNVTFAFDKGQYIMHVLTMCQNEHEEAYCLFYCGQRIFNLETKVHNLILKQQ